MPYGSYYPGNEQDYDFGGSQSGSFYNDYYNAAYPDQVSRAVNAMSGGGTTNLASPRQQPFDYAAFARDLDTSSMEDLAKKLRPRQMPGSSIGEIIGGGNVGASPLIRNQQQGDPLENFLNFIMFMQRVGPLLYGGGV